jgi:hypothetical protein
VVPLNGAALLDTRIASLEAIVRRSLALASETSIGFAEIVLQSRPGLLAQTGIADSNLLYGGIPPLARWGFLSSYQPSQGEVFANAVDRLRGRPSGGRDQLRDDDLAVLGIAAGISAISTTGDVAAERRTWLLAIASETADPSAWSHRARQLAADLLDGAGRMRADPRGSADALALDLVLRHAWPTAFATTAPITADQRRLLMEDLLSMPLPADGELERAAVWLGALTLLVRGVAAELVPDIHTLIKTLKATQSALRRWIWDVKPNRTGVAPARWLIDTEAHVQAFLWAVLEPHFGDQLVDEQYLPGYGQLQPRFDFGVAGLKTIVEVKIARTAGDFAKIEEEVAGDLGIYFSAPERYDRMTVFIYDDCDLARAERYDTLRSALLQRDSRIIDVVIVRRPSMIPDRASRQA